MVQEVQSTTPRMEDLWSDIKEYNNQGTKHSLVQADKDLQRPDGSTPSWLGTYLRLIEQKGVALPAIVITTKTVPTKLLHVGPSPTSLDQYKQLIQEHGG